MRLRCHTIMNMKYLNIITVLMLLTVSAKAASPEEEARFLKDVDDAFTKQNVAAIVTNICWDNASDAQRISKAWLKNYFSLESTNNSPCCAVYVDVREVRPAFTNWAWNLRVVKWIQITHAPKEAMLNAEGHISYQDLAVGEKEGKLMIAMRFKQHE